MNSTTNSFNTATPLLDSNNSNLIVRTLINADYEKTHAQMLHHTLARIDKKKQGIVTPDELWVVEHNDVYTLGQAGKEEHILQRGNTPIIHTDRGGQVTWHGKGQLVVYWLIDLNNVGWGVRDLVSHAEQSIEDVINHSLNSRINDNQHVNPVLHGNDNAQQQTTDISKQTTSSYYAKARQDAPGVYIYNQDELMLGKIASLGFKIKHGFSYHGIAVNLTCDLSAFNAINPCGYAGMQMLKLADFVDLTTLKLSTIDEEQPDTDLKSNGLNSTDPNNTGLNSTGLNRAYLNTQLTQANNSHAKPANIDGLDIVQDSITQLEVTQQLLINIMQRQAGMIKLRQ